MKQHYLKDKQEILQKIGGYQFNQCVLNEMTEADVNAAWHIITNEENIMSDNQSGENRHTAGVFFPVVQQFTDMTPLPTTLI